MKGGNLFFLRDYSEIYLTSQENMGFFKKEYNLLPNDLPKIPVKTL